jgi:hypothetical protein
MARPEVTGKKSGPGIIPDYWQQTDNIPFDQRLFTSKQAMEILQDGKTKFYEQDLPELELKEGVFLDGNNSR